MPPLPGFTDNPLKTRADVVHAAKAIVRPLVQYTSPGCAYVRLPVTSGTLYDDRAARLEGFARPLWVTGSLLASGDCDEELLVRVITGLSNGTDPGHSEYWGDIEDNDQRMVETEPIAFTLLSSPRHLLWDRLEDRVRSNVARWFLQLNGKQMPRVNWLWFRVFTNLVLLKLCEIDDLSLRKQMDTDLEELDTFYLLDGWSSDGLWRSSKNDDDEWLLLQQTGRVHSIKPDRCVDYYSGSFAIQFSQLLYIRLAGDIDPLRTSRYQKQAREFGSQIWRYFDEQGASIPFGRSMIYRFCCGAFFASLAVAGVSDMPTPLHRPGGVKGFLLRHLRWWARNSSDIFHLDGTLNLGWIYPNMYLTEDYNSPQSVYWALKSFVAIMLPSDEPFWADHEQAYPQLESTQTVAMLHAPRQVICNTPKGHHFLLSSAQFTSLHWKGAAAKYSKFAYSSAFGFSVPTGQATLQQLAPDNMLALSRDGTQTWAVKWKCREPRFGVCKVHSSESHMAEELPTMQVVWYPWDDRSVSVTTTLIPPSRRWPDWHIRVHRIRIEKDGLGTLFTAEGGFAINGELKDSERWLQAIDANILDQVDLKDDLQGYTSNANSAVTFSNTRVSGITGLVLESPSAADVRQTVSVLKPEANTNIMSPRSLLPLMKHQVTGLKRGDELVLCTRVFAIVDDAIQPSKPNGHRWKAWQDGPSLGSSLGDLEEFIDLP
ncbi:unnamed protein product [Clonostachys rosea]|uniref:Linalool dehydratase/isomerase domain-containing protein n=1 Tax=Bionectria ochroleuca TaxID=29856 RepID=A0ABY6UYJ8_BIOOC|nr:unnamed protein product [Clonostachys rosea]